MKAAIATEWLKLRRSLLPLVVTVLVVLVIPAMSYGLFWVAINGGFGPLAAKSSGLIVGEGWEGYLSAVGQIAAVGVFLAIGVATIWVFGREYVDQTFASLFALPVSRSSIAYAKFLVTAGWSGTLSVAMVVAVGLVGIAADLGEVPPAGIGASLARVLILTILASGLGLTSAVVASRWRGYLPAIGGLILIVAIAQMAVLFGTGGWFSYAVPGLVAVSGADGVPAVTPAQLGLVPVLIGVAIWATARIWQRAEAV